MPLTNTINELGAPAGEALKAAGETCGSLESTSAGLISACLQSVPHASRFWQGGVVIYSRKSGKAFLPIDIRKKLGSPEHNYASPVNYIESKKIFTKLCGHHFKKKMDVDWFVSESGAADAAGLPGKLRASGAFTVITILGPNDFEMTQVLHGSSTASRVENMWFYCKEALKLLEGAVLEEAQRKKTSKL